MLILESIRDDKGGDPMSEVRGSVLYGVALAEVNATIPAALPDTAGILVRDVRDLMILAFMRGVTWAAERH